MVITLNLPDDGFDDEFVEEITWESQADVNGNYYTDGNVISYTQTITDKTTGQLQESQKDFENFMKIIDDEGIEKIKQGNSLEKRNWLEKLVEFEGRKL